MCSIIDFLDLSSYSWFGPVLIETGFMKQLKLVPWNNWNWFHETIETGSMKQLKLVPWNYWNWFHETIETGFMKTLNCRPGYCEMNWNWFHGINWIWIHEINCIMHKYFDTFQKPYVIIIYCNLGCWMNGRKFILCFQGTKWVWQGNDFNSVVFKSRFYMGRTALRPCEQGTVTVRFSGWLHCDPPSSKLWPPPSWLSACRPPIHLSHLKHWLTRSPYRSAQFTDLFTSECTESCIWRHAYDVMHMTLETSPISSH